jgi:hypothetical protein
VAIRDISVWFAANWHALVVKGGLDLERAADLAAELVLAA